MFHDMVKVALTQKKLELLEERIKKDAENDPVNALSLEEFQDILNGSLPNNINRLESFIAILDPDGEIYQASKWRDAWESENIQSSNPSTNHHIINGN